MNSNEKPADIGDAELDAMLAEYEGGKTRRHKRSNHKNRTHMKKSVNKKKRTHKKKRTNKNRATHRRRH